MEIPQLSWECGSAPPSAEKAFNPNPTCLEVSCPIDMPATEDLLGLLCAADLSETGDKTVQSQIVPST